MAIKNDRKGETWKHWVTPELRKISIEQITATTHGGVNFDGGTTKPNVHTAASS